MRIHLVAAALATLVCCEGYAQPAMRLLIPSPWTIGITIARLLEENREKIFYVEVIAEGSDLEEARKSAFRMAVERAVGTVIASESESKNGELTRDDIVAYSAGYVKDYQLVETNPLEDRVQVKMKVWVSPSKLADRLLNQSRADGLVEGSKIAQQIESLEHERANGDRLLRSILQDYPYRAFDVKVLPTKVSLDKSRSPTLHVFLDLAWNHKYVDSLGVAVKAINQRQGCDRWFKPRHCDSVSVHIRAGEAQAWMDDEVAWNLFLKETIISKPQILLTAFDSSGRWLFKQCVGISELDHEHYAPYHYVEVDAGRVLLNTGLRKRIEIPISIGTYPISTKELDRVDAMIVRAQNCK